MLKFYRTRPGKFMAINFCLALIVCVLMLVHSFRILHCKRRTTVVKTRDDQLDDRVVVLEFTGRLLEEESSENKIDLQARHEVDHDPNFMPYMFQKNATPGFIFGSGRRKPVTVVIGIPHVKRPSGDSYLNKTLDSLTQRIFPADEDETAIVVFIAEKDDESYVRLQARASAFLTFYNLKPIDWLISDVLHTIGCAGIPASECSLLLLRIHPKLPNPLFFHIGYNSSLPGRTYAESYDEEIFFGNLGITTKHRNPLAEIQTPIKSERMEHNLKQWYMDSGGLTEDFCIYAAVADDFIAFKFKELESVSHILIKTGIFGSKVDSRMGQGCAVLEVSKGPKRKADYNVCGTSDYSGNLECRFSTPKSLTGFRISIKEEVEKPICFSVIYVKTLITMKKNFVDLLQSSQ